MQDLRGYGRGWVGGKGMTFGREQEETLPLGYRKTLRRVKSGIITGIDPCSIDSFESSAMQHHSAKSYTSMSRG